MTTYPFTHRFRVRYSEVDPQSVVFNARYLDYGDLVLTEYWRSLDIHFGGEQGLEFHVVKATVDFKKPIRADEWVDGKARTAKVGNSSCITEVALYGTEGDDDLRATIELVNVHVDLESGKPLPIPDPVRERFLAK